MRIALCGASGTGKTTLARHIAEKRGLEINPVGSRSVAREMGFDSPYDVDAAGRRTEFQRRLLAAKVAWEREHDAFVTDRTTLDNLAYSMLHAPREIDTDHYSTALAAMERYDVVLLCGADVFCEPGDDPARVKDFTYHRLFDAALRGLLAQARAGFYRRGSLAPPHLRVIELPAGLDARREVAARLVG